MYAKATVAAREMVACFSRTVRKIGTGIVNPQGHGKKVSMSEELGPGELVRQDCLIDTTHSRWQNETARAALLSSREIQVFWLLGNGRSNRAIAGQLQITERTVKAHVARIMAKLGVESRLQAGLVSYAYQLAQHGRNACNTIGRRCSCTYMPNHADAATC
ncbi:LuxR C-terminal-related transcriptional regulator [Nocardia otitidiscaviarum]|uniref:response regulator transcription factor n=1 Tax=Nocardia otitidiscaviarum TaxID=1823 RepID=UPI00163DDCD2|nr:LuxR C-terminal-related transcriptional regulator [Nocardia otitidiscaviarum]MCP9624663.1 LuxR C-terminal-related transcriptional regulator [Nocardia otitidiscaviarum]